jgi:hypothetical protein
MDFHPRRLSGARHRAQAAAQKPLAPSASTIRLWGVLVDYKPKLQRRWSKALVRHGAVAREAIAAVLGVPAEDIGVRDLTTL